MEHPHTRRFVPVWHFSTACLAMAVFSLAAGLGNRHPAQRACLQGLRLAGWLPAFMAASCGLHIGGLSHHESLAATRDRDEAGLIYCIETGSAQRHGVVFCPRFVFALEPRSIIPMNFFTTRLLIGARCDGRRTSCCNRAGLEQKRVEAV